MLNYLLIAVGVLALLIGVFLFLYAAILQRRLRLRSYEAALQLAVVFSILQPHYRQSGKTDAFGAPLTAVEFYPRFQRRGKLRLSWFTNYIPHGVFRTHMVRDVWENFWEALLARVVRFSGGLV